jgi:Ca2+-binding RTX toxin-like protein
LTSDGRQIAYQSWASNLVSGDSNNASDVFLVTNTLGLPSTGFDRVLASTSSTLPDAVESLQLTGSLAINGTGNSLDNTLVGNTGANKLNGLAGNDDVDGGNGLDTSIYSHRLTAYQISQTAVSGPEGADTLTRIERLAFEDSHVAFDTDGNTGQVYRLYKAAFARTPDLPGLGGWIEGLDNGQTLERAASVFAASPEFTILYGSNTSNEQFVTLLYLNALGRAPGVGEVAGWANQITAGSITRAQVLTQFSESVENKDAVQSRIADGILYATADQTTIATQGLTLTGTAGVDSLIGSVAHDTLTGLGADDSLNGGAGVDTAVYSGARAGYSITRTDTGLSVSGEGTDTLINIERLQFSDGGLAFDVNGNAGQVYRLYQAAFDRTPDVAGLSDWMRGMDQGMTLQKVATGFIGSTEFQNLYGASPTDTAFVNLLYQNVLNREPDTGGEAYWLDELGRGMTREMALIGFSESAENQVAVIGVIQDGIAFNPW